jgi:hypothetical protein
MAGVGAEAADTAGHVGRGRTFEMSFGSNFKNDETLVIRNTIITLPRIGCVSNPT